MRLFPLIACLPALLSAQDPREIVRRSVELDRKSNEIARNYTYLQRQETRQLDSSGKVKDRESRTWDVTIQEGSPYRRLIARNDKPLSAGDQKKEDESLQRSEELRRKETPEQHRQRIAEWDRRQQRQREPLKEMLDAFDFKLVGQEALNGGESYVIDATPKPGYKPKSSSTGYLRKVKARLWIDKTDYQWAKLDVETLDTITFGGFLFRMAKGGRLTIEQARINNEVWLPKSFIGHGSARIALIKVLRGEIVMTFSDYKKFQTDSRIVSTEPALK